MQQGKTAVNIRDLKKLDKHNKVQQNQEECIDGLKEALDMTMELTESYLDKYLFDYCMLTSTIKDLTEYIKGASQREADILIKKIHNLFEATPKNKAILTQMPVKKLIEAAQKRLSCDEAYKRNNHKMANYDFMVNMLTLERALAKTSHPFIILSLNASNLFTGMVTLWNVDALATEEYAMKLNHMLSSYKSSSAFFEMMYPHTAFICLEALSFDIHTKMLQKEHCAFASGKAIHC